MNVVVLCGTDNIAGRFMIYEWFHHRKRMVGNGQGEKFLFSLSLQKVKNTWKQVIKSMDVWEKERWRYHGLRKGFATSLQQREIPQGLVAYAGRWNLVASMYQYICYTLEDMLEIAPMMWDRDRETLEFRDLDAWEMETLKDVKGVMKLMDKGTGR